MLLTWKEVFQEKVKLFTTGSGKSLSFNRGMRASEKHLFKFFENSSPLSPILGFPININSTKLKKLAFGPNAESMCVCVNYPQAKNLWALDLE